jgi:hypothetical protein
MTFAISLQLPARGTGRTSPRGIVKHARAQKAAVSPTARRPRARAQPPVPAVPPPRHQARAQPSPIRMLARVTRSRQRPMNPALLQKRGALEDD